MRRFKRSIYGGVFIPISLFLLSLDFLEAKTARKKSDAVVCEMGDVLCIGPKSSSKAPDQSTTSSTETPAIKTPKKSSEPSEAHSSESSEDGTWVRTRTKVRSKEPVILGTEGGVSGDSRTTGSSRRRTKEKESKSSTKAGTPSSRGEGPKTSEAFPQNGADSTTIDPSAGSSSGSGSGSGSRSESGSDSESLTASGSGSGSGSGSAGHEPTDPGQPFGPSTIDPQPDGSLKRDSASSTKIKASGETSNPVGAQIAGGSGPGASGGGSPASRGGEGGRVGEEVQEGTFPVAVLPDQSSSSSGVLTEGQRGSSSSSDRGSSETRQTGSTPGREGSRKSEKGTPPKAGTPSTQSTTPGRLETSEQGSGSTTGRIQDDSRTIYGTETREAEVEGSRWVPGQRRDSSQPPEPCPPDGLPDQVADVEAVSKELKKVRPENPAECYKDYYKVLTDPRWSEQSIFWMQNVRNAYQKALQCVDPCLTEPQALKDFEYLSYFCIDWSEAEEIRKCEEIKYVTLKRVVKDVPENESKFLQLGEECYQKVSSTKKDKKTGFRCSLEHQIRTMVNGSYKKWHMDDTGTCVSGEKDLIQEYIDTLAKAPPEPKGSSDLSCDKRVIPKVSEQILMNIARWHQSQPVDQKVESETIAPFIRATSRGGSTSCIKKIYGDSYINLNLKCEDELHCVVEDRSSDQTDYYPKSRVNLGTDFSFDLSRDGRKDSVFLGRTAMRLMKLGDSGYYLIYFQKKDEKTSGDRGISTQFVGLIAPNLPPERAKKKR